MELRDFADFVERQKWIFAKTYADRAPHDYIVKDKLDEDDMSLFSEIVAFIRHFRFHALFGGTSIYISIMMVITTGLWVIQ